MRRREQMSSRQRLFPLWICLGLAAITVAGFWPVARCNFINFDDPDYVTENAHVLRGVDWSNVRWAFTTGEAGNWHPITWLSHCLDCQMFGTNPAAHHLMNLGLHVANTLLVFLILRQMTGAMWCSAAVAALFGVHPLHVEAVAWVSERKEVLSFFLFMATIGAYAEYARRAEGISITPQQLGGKTPHAADQNAKTPRRVFYVLSLLFFAVGLMSKPMLVTAPFVLLLLDYWPLGRATSDGWRVTRRLVIEKMPFLALSAASSVVTYIVQQKGGAIKESVSFSARLGNALVAYTRYLGKALWPHDLAVVYPHPGKWRAVTVLAAGGMLLLISVVVWEFGRRRKYLVTGWLWFLGTLVPVIGFLQVGSQAMADRYTYMPLIGILLMLVWGAGDWIRALTPGTAGLEQSLSNVSRSVTAVGVLFFVAICATISNLQTRYWRNSGTLFGHALQVTQNNYLAEDKLGLYLADHGHSAQAIEHYRASLKINPAFGETHNNLGVELARTGQITEAMLSFSNAVELNPRLAAAFNNLGMGLTVSGRRAEALEPYERSLELEPRNPRFHRNLAQCLAGLGRLDEAVVHYREAAGLTPQDPEPRVELAKALGQQGRIAEAIDQCRQALRMNGSYDPAKQVLAALQSLETNAPPEKRP